VIVNCGAVPAELLASELFGYEHGAFTGAWQRYRGLLSAADGGTLFLDEVADLPLSALLGHVRDGRALGEEQARVRVAARTLFGPPRRTDDFGASVVPSGRLEGQRAMPSESRLVSAAWLAERLGSPGVRVIEVASVNDGATYREGHIPGAVWWYWKTALWHDTDREFPTAEVTAGRLGRIGVTPETTVVLYGDPVQYGTFGLPRRDVG